MNYCAYYNILFSLCVFVLFLNSLLILITSVDIVLWSNSIMIISQDSAWLYGATSKCRWISQSFPEKQNQMYVYVWILIRRYSYRCRCMFMIRNWFMQLWRLTSSRIWGWQAGDPGQLVVVQVWRAAGSTPRKSQCFCFGLKAGKADAPFRGRSTLLLRERWRQDQPFCSMKVSIWWHKAHPFRENILRYSPTLVLFSSKNPLTEIPTIVFDQISGPSHADI